MNLERAISLIDNLIYEQTGKHLSDLQHVIICQVWQGKKYLEIAEEYSCTEGHVKDVGSQLWKTLTAVWGETVTKSNLRTVATRQLKEPPSVKTEVTGELPNFVGRKEAIAQLQTLVAQDNKIIVICGKGGVGKTTLARQFLSSSNFDLVLEVLMAKETQNIISAASIVEEWLVRDFQDESANELGINLARLKRHLETKSVGILIDNLEPALDKNGKFLPAYRNYLELLRILADRQVKSTTVITSRDRLCEPDITLAYCRLSGLNLTAWERFFSFHQIKTTTAILELIHRTYGGNAKAMGIICGIVAEDFERDLVAYWRENYRDPLVETDVKNLVASQFDRLQHLDPIAYSLLCRLSAYRYRDLPTLARSAVLALLWDVETNKQLRGIKALRDRSLIEFSTGNYWLHPIIKAEGMLRLQTDKREWRQTQRQIAQFWTQSIERINSVSDGLTALEAYYHYLAIADYNAAAKVILFSRNNRWNQHLTLGTTLYRLGLVQPLMTAITQIIDRLPQDLHQSELNNILGDIYWTVGKVRNAIACQQQTISTAKIRLQILLEQRDLDEHQLYYWRMLEIDSLLSIGLYQIDLWELSAAADSFRQVITLASNTKHHSWAEKAAICLALVNSYSKNLESQTSSAIAKFYEAILAEDKRYNTGRFAYFIQLLGQIYLNLKQIEPARILFTRAIAFSQASHYLQIKAKALTGMGVIYRFSNDFDLAVGAHQQAIAILEKIGAKCDLAAAYFQYALTLQSCDKLLASGFVNRALDSQNYFAKAIALFEQIEAPKQVAKVMSVAECV